MSNWQLGLLFILYLIFWTPLQFQISLNMSNSRYLTFFNMLGYVPFVLAFLMGLSKGKDIVLKVGFVGLFAALISSFFAIWDLNRSMEGGWSHYGSWVGLILTVIVETIIVGILTYLGGLLKGAFFR